SAKKPAKPAPKKPSLADLVKSTPLVPGTAIVVASNVNVRGQAGLKGEVLTKISIGVPVTVIEEVTLKNSKEDEPSAWAKIGLPAGAHAWVNTAFVNASNQTVIPKKLNVRGGPGENYSVIGLLEKGAAVKVLTTKGDWTEIEPPAGAYAFVAAQYLKQETPAIAAVATPAPPTEPAPTPTPVTEPAPVAPTTTDATNVASAPVVGLTAPPPALEPAPAPVEPPPPRIIQHEGIVKGTVSIQAPTKFGLVSPDTGKTINYLYTTSTNLDLNRYKGLHIIVTGEEGLDERWRNTPVLTIQRIQVLE
ncbi:MAG TPA: SH3 domain-containing protein, partial [Verrucomicrobiae bacterium]